MTIFESTQASTSVSLFQFGAEAQLTVPPYLGFARQVQLRPSFYQEFAAHQLLHHLKDLGEDWDGYGAAPIHADTILNAHRALSEFLLSVPVPEIVPNSNGTVSFEWETSLGSANIEIGLTRFSFYLKPSHGPIIPVDGSSNEIPPVLGSVISALLFPATGAQLTATTTLGR